MTFEKTTDMTLVKSLLTIPALWRRMVDDSAPAPEEFVPTVRDRLIYVVARHHSRVVGLFVLVAGFHEAEVHFAITPEAWGRERTVRIVKEFIDWVWQETSINRLIGPIPAHNRLCVALAKACGFEVFGAEEACLTKNGRWWDRILMEVNRPVEVKRPDAA